MLKRALRIKEAHYGKDHYEVAITFTNRTNAEGVLWDLATMRDMLQNQTFGITASLLVKVFQLYPDSLAPL